ncbi:MAG: acetyl-CoA carboxylase biotin carboxylase subunit, partial [Bdellovibrionales bacterium]|nr:acetyl-CoA carboxylase biotin carboxylase subunit [Bdellovibrionales bacterium]
AGAGTVEFLLDGENFYFLEMNTRLQVEHTVTEEVVGVDLVKAQIRIAEGLSIPWTEAELRPQGHSIECRIYAEDPYQGGIPSIGKVHVVRWPYGPGRRFETAIESGDEVTSFYDPMIAKVIVWDNTRSAAIHKMIRTLEDSVIFGIKTNIPLLKEILSHQQFQEGTMNIQFMNTFFPDGLAGRNTPTAIQNVADTLWRDHASELENSALSASALGSTSDSAASGAPFAVRSPFVGRWRNV